MATYGSPAYSMGAVANAPITSVQAQKGKLELAKMRRSLVAWLKYRTLNDRVMAGLPIPPPVLRRPGHKPLPPQAMATKLRSQRAADEQALATQLYQLLGEVFDPGSLPEPDLARNPTAAVELARIAVAGKLPGEVTTSSGPAATGAIWMWPVVVVIGVIAFTITTAIRSSADVAKERERIECIKAGACTDTGFFLKLAAVAVLGWLAWDKLGLRERVRGALGK